MTLLLFLAALLVATPGIAFGAFAFIVTGRLLPGIRSLVLRQVKPFACNPCASMWGGILGAGAFAAFAGSWWYLLIGAPAAGMTLFLLERYAAMAEPPGLPPPVPEDGHEP